MSATVCGWVTRTAGAAGVSGSVLLCSALCLVVAIAPAAAGGAHSLYIVDANSGAVLADQDGNDARYPASLTKMMTLYLAFEGLDRGTLTMQTPLKISQAAANAAPSKLELAVGEEIALGDAIKALITKSANDIAIALAEQIGGTEANFARLMTAKARDIGMKNTTFKNASGLPDSGQTTTARDMVTLGLHLYDDHPRYFALFAMKSFAYNGGTHKNHNTLMVQMPGINGIKTGYTHASGFNLVTSLERDGKHVIGAIFGGESAASRNSDMRIALTRALAKASTAKTRKPVLMATAQSGPLATAAPAKAAPVKRVPGPAPVGSTPDPEAAVVAAQAAAGPRIDVAKVRTVDVAAVAPRPAVPPPAARAPVAGFAEASTTPRLSDVLKARASKEPGPAADSRTRQPSRFEQQLAVTAQNLAPVESEPVAQPAAPLPAPTLPAPIAAARPPSSLNAQLARLTAPPPAPAPMAQPSYRLKGPDAGGPAVREATAAPARGGYEIQIGAYASPAEADKRLSAALAQLPALLHDHIPSRQSVTANDKTLYRARFGGFDGPGAGAACAELMRQSITCLAVKAE